MAVESSARNAASDLIVAAVTRTEATAAGEITPGEAASLSMLVGNVAKAVETFELSIRLAKLEEQLAAKGGRRPARHSRRGGIHLRMPSRIRDRLERLESQLAPQRRVFVFCRHYPERRPAIFSAPMGWR